MEKFDYEQFKNLLDNKGKEKAMKFYNKHFKKKNSKLATVMSLESAGRVH